MMNVVLFFFPFFYVGLVLLYMELGQTFLPFPPFLYRLCFL